MANKIKKAVIPAGGLGTRLLPITKEIPKELLPINFKPMIQYSIEESVNSGIEQICIVIHPDKEIIKNYFHKSPNIYIKNNEQIKALEYLKKRCDIEFVYQEKPEGLAHAVLCAEIFIDKDDFALLLPDNIYISKTPFIKQIMETFQRYNKHCIGLMEITGGINEGSSNCGILDLELVREREYKIRKIPNKKRGLINLQPGETFKRTVGRYVLKNEFFDYAKSIKINKAPEFDEVSIMQKLATENKLYGKLLDGTGFNTGTQKGYISCINFFDKYRNKRK